MASPALKAELIVLLLFCSFCFFASPTLSQGHGTTGHACFSCCTVDSTWCSEPKQEPYNCTAALRPSSDASLPDNENITITEEDLYECLNEQSLTVFDARAVSLTLGLLGTDLCRPHNWSKADTICRVRLTPHKNFVFSKVLVGEINMTRPLTDVGFQLVGYDGFDVLGDVYANMNSAETRVYPSRDVHPLTHTVLTLVISRKAIGNVAINIQLETASNPQAADHLQAFCYLSNKGYIQTSGWNGENKYVANSESCVTLVIPANHVIMVSFIGMDIKTTGNDDDNLTLHTEVDCRGEGQKIQDPRNFDPIVYDKTEAVSIFFSSNVGPGKSGFRLLYSFHPKAASPEKLPDGKWNCSVSYFSHFRQHFMCSAKVFCSDSQTISTRRRCVTEELCGVTSNVRQWELGGHCYRMFNPLGPYAWNEAAQKCASLQGHLVDLNTEPKRKLFWNMTKFTAFDVVFAGFKLSAENEMYTFTWTWSDDTLAVFLGASNNVSDRERPCGAILLSTPYSAIGVPCDLQTEASFVCEDFVGRGGEHIDSSSLNDSYVSSNNNINKSAPISTLPTLTPPAAAGGTTTTPVKMVKCLLGHMAPDFLACDSDMNCSSVDFASSTTCAKRKFSVEVPFFTCRSMLKLVPFLMVCDNRIDCCDGSDETFCHYPACRENEEFACGGNKRCIPLQKRCDGRSDCDDNSDEAGCEEHWRQTGVLSHAVLPPARVDFTGRGDFVVTALSSASCPETHFLCPGNGTYCLPVYVRCNGVFDCPGKEDEMGCDALTCPGFYRCRVSKICLHYDHLCDGVFQCPKHDDELMCNFTCPGSCTCFGFAFICADEFPVGQYSDLRYLDASGSRMTLNHVSSNKFLIQLVLRHCGITTIGSVDLPNLQSLDLSYNNLHSVTSAELSQFNNLRFLTLAHNQLISLVELFNDHHPFPYILEVSFAGLRILEWNDTFSDIFPNVRLLNVSYSGINKLSESGFRQLKQLRELDISGCPVHTIFPDIFEGLGELNIVRTENYKLCCPSVLPAGFDPNHCYAPTDEISSCDALLRSEVFRVFLTVYALLSLLGNLGSFMYRTFVDKKANKLGFDVFVTHLCVSDFMMGVYLAIIGVADRMYYGDYIWKDIEWRHSAACQVAGFLSLLSSEVSAFIICLITLERFLVIRFPFKNLRFSQWSAHVACFNLWLIGVVMATVPLLPHTDHWEFYGNSGICVPLPITRKVFPGRDYAFGVVVGLNFVLFVLIAVGQVFIYWSVRANTMSAKYTSKKSEDMTVAHRLLAVVMTDFMCWFPIGLLGILARVDVPIPGEVNVIMAVFVLPFNSALNPFLYTFNMLMERRRKARASRSMKKSSTARSLHQVSVEMTTSPDRPHSENEAWRLFDAWLDDGVLKLDRVRRRVLDMNHGQHM